MDTNHPNIIPCFGMSEVTDQTVDPQPALVFLRCSNGSIVQYLPSHGDADVHTLVRPTFTYFHSSDTFGRLLA